MGTISFFFLFLGIFWHFPEQQMLNLSSNVLMCVDDVVFVFCFASLHRHFFEKKKIEIELEIKIKIRKRYLAIYSPDRKSKIQNLIRNK